MSLEIIQTLNPEYTIKSITDEAFRTYGKVIDNNIDEAIEFCIDFVQAAKQVNFYLPSVLEVEQLSSIIELSHRVYGYLEIIAGIDSANSTLAGISVGGANFKETANLGAKAKESEFTDQFAGLEVTPGKVYVLNEDVDQISGATITSDAVLSGVNKLTEYMSQLIENDASTVTNP